MCYPSYSIDSDMDGRSTAVESEMGTNASSADDNDSIAGGTPTNGTLDDGIRIANSSTDYYYFRGGDTADTDNWGTLALVNTIEHAGRCWDDEDHPDMGVGDMSLEGGDDWTPDHSSHLNGIDVDVRYVRNDGETGAVTITSGDYDESLSIALIACFLGRGRTALVYTSDQDIVDYFEGISEDRVEYLSGHSNHFHVRITDPDGTSN